MAWRSARAYITSTLGRWQCQPKYELSSFCISYQQAVEHADIIVGHKEEQEEHEEVRAIARIREARAPIDDGAEGGDVYYGIQSFSHTGGQRKSRVVEECRITLLIKHYMT